MEITTHLSRSIASSRRNPCPICQKGHGCKISSDLILCLRGESHWSIPGWRYIKPLSNGMGSLWGTDTGTKTEYRPEPRIEKKSNINPLTDEQLDKNARLILGQLGLSSKHRQALRCLRGLTDAEIDAIGFKSVDAYQTFTLTPNLSFPGMGYKGTLTNKDSGYLIPVRNIEGLIIGFQIANDHRGEEDKNGEEIPKYQWLWGSRERRTSGELPLQFLKINDSTDLNIIEGSLKPVLSAYRHNINVLGSGGVIWHESKKEFEAILNSNLFVRHILNPDTGCKANHHVICAYRELFNFLKARGIQLWVRDWGQEEKPKSDQLDLDNINPETFNNAQIIPFEQWAGIESDADDFAPQTLTQDQWFKRFKLPQLQEELTQTLKRFFNHRLRKKQAKTETKGFAQNPTPETASTSTSSAIVLWKPQRLTSIPYTPGQLLTVEEWQQLGSPKLIIQQGQRLTFYSEAYDRGFKHIKDSTPTGHGKSYDAGLIDLPTFGIDPNNADNKTRIFYASPDHRNPTNATIEANYSDLEARHDGLIYDHSRKTALGKPHVIRSVGNQNPDIPSNCPENNTFLTVADLGLPVFGGKDSPICQSCPLLLKGCTFLENRRDTLANERLIRADINSIPTPSSDDILIIEEAGINIKNNYQVTIMIDEVIRTVGKLHLRDDQRIFKALRPFLTAVYRALQSIKADKHKYGIPHNKVMELMPSVDELNQTIWKLYSDDWLKTDDVWGTPIWDYEMINGEPEAVKIIGYDWVAPSLNDLKKECFKIFESYAKYINGLQSPESKQEAIKANIIPSWLPNLIDCLTGNKRINLQIGNGKLIITKRSNRHRNIIKSSGFSIALDATQSKEDYALSLGINPDDVLEVTEVQRCTPNLHIHIINGLGKGGKQRRETQQERIRIAIEAIAQRHPGQSVGLIDHKSAMDSYQDLAQSLKLGYWHRDTRGSNQFLTTQTMISVGSPVPNLGQMAAEYQTLTGWIVNSPERLIGRYGLWVNRKTASELIQCLGRLRAHLRPNEQLHSYLVADLDDDIISRIRLAFPGATVTVEDVYDFAPEAATKGTQTERGIIEALWLSVQSGVPATIDEIAERLGLTKGGVSKNLKDRLGIGFRLLKKSLLLLLEAINSKSKLSDLPEDAQWMAVNYLPLVVQSLESGQITPADVVVEVVDTVRCFGRDIGKRILAATPTPILCKLLGIILRFLPQIRQELIELIPNP